MHSAVIKASKELRPYSRAHMIKVLTDNSLTTMYNLKASGRHRCLFTLE